MGILGGLAEGKWVVGGEGAKWGWGENFEGGGGGMVGLVMAVAMVDYELWYGVLR